MKAAVFHAPLDVRLEDVPEPTAGEGEVKLRIRNCSTCGTDVKIFNNGHQNMDPPQVMGHEIAGEIVEVGDQRGVEVDVADEAEILAEVEGPHLRDQPGQLPELFLDLLLLLPRRFRTASASRMYPLIHPRSTIEPKSNSPVWP